MAEWQDHLLTGALIIGVAILSLAVVQVARRQLVRALNSREKLHQERRQQALTLVGIGAWVLTVLIVGAAILALLSDWGVDIAPLLAGAGVVGLALSLGAQTLIKDLIGGLFILFENQYSVGDTIQVGTLSGEVERMTLRATSMRGADGQLVIIPNGEVRIVSNLTREWSRALVDLSVAYEEDLERVLSVLREAAAAFWADPAFAPDLLEAPEVLGPMSMGEWAITLRVMVKTRPGKQWEIARELRKRLLAVREREGIALPYPRQEVVTRGVQPSGPAAGMRAGE